MANKRKICFVLTSFIHYSRNLLILRELNKDPKVDLHVVIAGSATLSKYLSKFTDVRMLLKKDGINNIHELFFSVEGDTVLVKAKITGLGILEFSTLFNEIKPDLVVVRGDRFEVLAAAVAASYTNIPVAHIEGGDVSGSIDESVRHAITKLSHIHFVTNQHARERVIRMGENIKYVFNFGSPDIEVANKLLEEKSALDLRQTGSGAWVDRNKDYLVVMYHSVTTDLENLAKNTRVLLQAVHELGIPVFWFWPNLDVGSEEISHELRKFNNEIKDHKLRFMRYLPPADFISILKDAKCLVGNSSAGIKECSYLGTPVVNVGYRQNGRLKNLNVCDVRCDVEAIKKAVRRQVRVGRYKQSKTYYLKGTSKRIAATLAKIPLYNQKQFYENKKK